MTLRPIPVSTPEQVERMRQMRNTCAEGFAHFTGLISPEEQQAWWAANQGRARAWLYATANYLDLVGFGLIRRLDDGRWYTTVGVLPAHGGHDYGKWITAHLIRQAPGHCYGQARRDNPAAVKLHVAEDWEVIDGPDPRLAYFRTWRAGALATAAHWPPEGAIDEWTREGWALG